MHEGGGTLQDGKDMVAIMTAAVIAKAQGDAGFAFVFGRRHSVWSFYTQMHASLAERAAEAQEKGRGEAFSRGYREIYIEAFEEEAERLESEAREDDALHRLRLHTNREGRNSL